MTKPNDDNLELDITRMLDGEMDEADAIELDRRLLRGLAAHRLMDRTAATDALAGDALRAAFGPGVVGAGSARPIELGGARGGRHPWAVAAAAAIVLAATAGIVWIAGGTGQSGGPGGSMASSPAGSRSATAAEIPAGAADLMWQMWDSHADDDHQAGAGDASVPLPPVQGPRDVKQQLDRQVYGVYDKENETIYLLGVDRVKTRVRAVGKDL